MKTKDRVLIKLLGKWCQRMKWSDYQSSPLVWLGGSSPPLKIEVVGSPQNIKNRQRIMGKMARLFSEIPIGVKRV